MLEHIVYIRTALVRQCVMTASSSTANPDKARRLITRLAKEETDIYEKLKKALMKEFKLTPLKYKDMFDRAFKEKNESYFQFATRLTVIWRYYMDSRGKDKCFLTTVLRNYAS